MEKAKELISAVKQADDPESLVAAVNALAAERLEAGISTLIEVLKYNNPGAALAAVAGLIQMGESAVIPLIEHLDDYDYGARAYAIRALATIADPRALDVLLTAAATDFAPSVRRAAAKGLGNLRWNQLPAEQIPDAQGKAVQTLLQVSLHPDWDMRYAAIVGLQALATSETTPQTASSQIWEHFQQMSQDSDPAVAARVQLAVAVGNR